MLEFQPEIGGWLLISKPRRWLPERLVWFPRPERRPRTQEGAWQAQEPPSRCHLSSKTKLKTLPRWWFCCVLTSCVLPFTSQRRTAQPLGIGAQNLHPHLPQGSQRPDNLSPEQKIAGSSNWGKEESWRTEGPAARDTQPPSSRPGVGLTGGPSSVCKQRPTSRRYFTQTQRRGCAGLSPTLSSSRGTACLSCHRPQQGACVRGHMGLSAGTWCCPFGRVERPGPWMIIPQYKSVTHSHRNPGPGNPVQHCDFIVSSLVWVMKLIGCLFPAQIHVS